MNLLDALIMLVEWTLLKATKTIREFNYKRMMFMIYMYLSGWILWLSNIFFEDQHDKIIILHAISSDKNKLVTFKRNNIKYTIKVNSQDVISLSRFELVNYKEISRIANIIVNFNFVSDYSIPENKNLEYLFNGLISTKSEYLNFSILDIAKEFDLVKGMLEIDNETFEIRDMITKNVTEFRVSELLSKYPKYV